MKRVKNKIIIGALALMLAGCGETPPAADSNTAVSARAIQTKLPKECVFRDLGKYITPDNTPNMRVVAVICQNAITTTTWSGKAGKTRTGGSVVFDTRE